MPTTTVTSGAILLIITQDIEVRSAVELRAFINYALAEEPALITELYAEWRTNVEEVEGEIDLDDLN